MNVKNILIGVVVIIGAGYLGYSNNTDKPAREDQVAKAYSAAEACPPVKKRLEEANADGVITKGEILSIFNDKALIEFCKKKN